MENVQSFLKAIKKYGVADEEIFQTPDLFEARNISQVYMAPFFVKKNFSHFFAKEFFAKNRGAKNEKLFVHKNGTFKSFWKLKYEILKLSEVKIWDFQKFKKIQH